MLANQEPSMEIISVRGTTEQRIAKVVVIKLSSLFASNIIENGISNIEGKRTIK